MTVNIFFTELSLSNQWQSLRPREREFRRESKFWCGSFLTFSNLQKEDYYTDFIGLIVFRLLMLQLKFWYVAVKYRS